MNICEKCFCDSEIISIITSKDKQGDCQICKTKNVFVYDTDVSDYLSATFDELISIYTPIKLLPSEFPKSETRLLKDELVNNWNIFNKRSQAEVYTIITNICAEKYAYMPELFDQPIGLKELYDSDYLNQHSLLKTNSWDKFTRALKNENRFHTDFINLQLLEKFCSYIRKPYKKGQKFYRSRISSDSGFDIGEMGAPPSEKASEGRANALGISCLYLGDSIETTIHEVRAGAFDYVTIGTFELNEDITVVDLKKINRIDPFIIGLDFAEHAINKEHLNKINDEMGKALRKSDGVLDYVPTQYISDFIKSIEKRDGSGAKDYSGIEYNSVINKGGYNLAVFNPQLFDCIAINTYKIDNLQYVKHEIK